MEDEEENHEKEKTQPRVKKTKLNIDPEVVYSIDVYQDLTLIQLETMEKYHAEIRLKGTNVQEKIEQLKPNMNSINEYRNKVYKS